MFEELDLPVLRLRRERYAFLTLEGLSAGQWRLCSDEEISRLAGPVPNVF
jgi:23S rRNA pseudouridine2605 synthase